MELRSIYQSKLTEPLTEAEFKYYFAKFWQGDMEAREVLIMRNMRLVAKAMTSFFGVPFAKEDLHHLGILALIKSVDTFDYTQNIKFSSYAMRCIYNEIYVYMRNNQKALNDIDLSSVEFCINSTNESVEEQIEDKDLKTIIRGIVESLPNTERTIIELYFGFYHDKCFEQKQIAKVVGLSQPEVSRRIKRILKKIALILVDMNIIEGNIPLLKPKAKVVRTGRIKNIYDLFGEYDSEKINNMLQQLSPEEKNLFAKRHNEGSTFTTEDRLKYYNNLVPRMKRILNNPNYKPRQKVVK